MVFNVAVHYLLPLGLRLDHGYTDSKFQTKDFRLTNRIEGIRIKQQDDEHRAVVASVGCSAAPFPGIQRSDNPKD